VGLHALAGELGEENVSGFGDAAGPRFPFLRRRVELEFALFRYA